MTERYNTPAEGTLDWHVPLNENFNKLDSDVEIRDIEANLSGYEPTSDAKFLATDTGAVYIGDGSQWNQLGSVSSTSSGTDSSDTGGQMADGSVVAEPGTLQSTLDSAAGDWSFGNGSYRKVRMVSGETYRPGSPVFVPSGVYLDCNGARIVPQGDFNVLELDRNTFVERPYVYTKPVSGYSSAALVVSAENTSKANSANPARVRNAHLFGGKQEGTGLRFRGGDSPCSMQIASGIVKNFRYGVHFFSDSGTGGWSNGNQFHGSINSSVIPVYLESTGAACSGNTVFAQVQTSSDTEWVVRQEDDPRGDNTDQQYSYRFNNYFIFPWDTGNVSNEYQSSDDIFAPFWYIGQGKHERCTFYDLSGTHSNEFVVNNSSLAGRNGVFVGHGGHHTGTTEFTGPKTYEPGPNRKTWHPGSDN